MTAFAYHGRELYCEEVPIAAIAQEVGTPCYIYSRSMLVEAIVPSIKPLLACRT